MADTIRHSIAGGIGRSPVLSVGFGPVLQQPSVTPPAFSRVVASNGNVVPFQFDTATTNNVRNSIHRKILAKNGVYTNIRLTYVNFASQQSNEVSTGAAFDLRSSIYYNGTWYPVTFGGLSTYGLAAGATIESDDIAGLTLDYTVCPDLYETCRILGPATSVTYPRSCVSDPTWGEGVLNNTNTAIDYTDGTLPMGAKGTVTVSGGNITAGTVTAGGANYVNNAQIWAYQYDANGTRWTKNVGNGVVSGGVVSSITISSGTPPVGLASWTSPSIHISYGGPNLTSANASAGYTASVISGIPDRAVKSLLLIADSIGRGNGGALMPDFNMNQGIYEIAVQNRCGVINAAIGSSRASTWSSLTGVYPKLFALLNTYKTSHALIALGTNDAAFGTPTVSTLESQINTIAGYCRTTLGCSTAISTIIPRTTSTDGWITTTNQTVYNTNFASGNLVDTVDADIASGTVVSNWGPVLSYLHMRDATVLQDWRVDLGAMTTDGTHPAYVGYGVPEINSTFQGYFSALT